MKLRLDQLEPNRWNANEVTGDKYMLLVKDMGEAGQREPVTVSPKYLFYGLAEDYGAAKELGVADFYVICDGEHRYKAAEELGWEELEATVEDLTEDQAVTKFYRQQATRGGFDPLREARMFQHYLDEGLTQEQVVEKLGLKNRAYLTDRIMLLNLSPLVQDLVANLKGMIAARIKERATNETEEELKELTEDIVARATIDLRQLRPISTLPENDQGILMSALIGTFAEGGAVTTRQVEAMVRDVRARNEKLESFNKAWNAAKVRVCPICGRPPTLDNWQQPGRDPRTFACVLGHMWRYDVTAEEAHEEERKARAAREEEQRRKLEESTRARKAEDAKTIDGILADYAEPPMLPDLMREFYSMSSYIDFGDARRAVALYLEEHPGVKLTEPLTPEQQEEKRRQDAEVRRIYIEAKMEDDEHILARISALYRDELTRKQLLDDYMELSRTIVPQDGRDVIALYLERHPEITFPGDEPVKGGISEELFDREVSAALGQPPMPEEQKKGKVWYTIQVTEFEEDDYARHEGGCRFAYNYDTGQGGGAGPIRDREGLLSTLRAAARNIWRVASEMASYPRPTMRNTRVEVCKAAADEGFITEAEIWDALLTYPATEGRDSRPKGELCDGCTEDCEECPHDQETDEEQEEPEAEEPEPEEEPLSLLMPITAAELHSRLVPWILGKVGELSDVKSIKIEGLRDREEVLLEYAEPDAKGRTKFSFRVQTTTPINENTSHIDSWNWTSFDTRRTSAGLEVTSSNLTTADEEDLAEITRFLDKTVYKDLDPWDDPDALMGPTGFTLTPVDSKNEPTIPVPDHGRGYQEEDPDLDAGEEYHEHYDHDEDPPEELSTCPKCGKVSPNTHYCTSCGKPLEKEE